jgi:NAD(P)-dependent dehydrogenase (short-subunit alcohol dehydrogenase family)
VPPAAAGGTRPPPRSRTSRDQRWRWRRRAACSAAEGGVVQLTRSSAEALPPEGTRVDAVAPGWIGTPLLAPLKADPELGGRSPRPPVWAPPSPAVVDALRAGQEMTVLIDR